MNKQVLITGATGMIGKALTKALLDRNYKVSILSTHPQSITNVQAFKWDVKTKAIDKACFEGVDTIIHLAGENIAKEKWTDHRKQEIIDSRVQSTSLLLESLKNIPHQVKSFVSASAVGFYGDRGEELLTEQSPVGQGFLAECCAKWEQSVDEAAAMGFRVLKLRTGVILAKEDGGLPAMAMPVKWFVGAPLGTGRQWIPWIHMADMIGMYLYVLEQELTGTFNAAGPNPVTNKTLTKALGKALHRPIWPLAVPAKVISLAMGEMSVIALNSTNISVEKILDAGYQFKYPHLQDALSEIYGE
jgi:uncharacterized protein (TIGR01777 family)